MAAIAPFRALRYNLARVGDLSAVVAPPYDVISPQQQAQLYAASPYNIVRLILGQRAPTDTDMDNWYTRAKRDFDAWQQAQVLVRDETPAIYLYEHAFSGQGQPPHLPGFAGREPPRSGSPSANEQVGGQRLRRLGCVARLSLDDASVTQVLSHESTFEGPKADRAKLLDVVEANLSPIFCLAPDPQQQMLALMRGWAHTQPPLAGVQLPSDETARIWAVTEASAIEGLQRLLAPVSLLIADGHHRFAVARSMRARFGTVMIYISTLEDPAVRVRPIHRVVRVPSIAPSQWATRLGALCEVAPAVSPAALTRWLDASEDQGRFGCYVDGRTYQVRLRDEVLADAVLRPTPTAVGAAGLDVTLLHHVLLPHLQAHPPTRLVGGQGGTATPVGALECVYTPDVSEAMAMVDRREGDGAWLLRGIPMAQVMALARQGIMLPQKTTYFYPKLLSGLFINPLE